MKENWEYKRLGEVATFINGYPFKPSEWKTNGTPIIRIQNLNNPLAEYNYCDKTLDERYLVKSGDVLISWSGSLGVFEWSGTNAFLNQHIFKVLFNKGEIDKFYFKYVVSSRIEEMKGKVHGITMQHITKSEFDKIMIPIPPLDEQKQIVTELDLLSGVIEKQKAELNELDNLAQSTFYDMFGDPIENPKGWDNFRLTDVCLKISDGSHNPPKGVDFSDYPMLSSKNILSGSYDYRDPRYLSKEDFDMENTRTNVSDGDVLFTIVGAIGRCCFVKEPFKKFVLQRSVAVLKPNRDMVDSPFLVYSLSSMTSYFERIANGIAQKGVYLKQLAQTQIPIPPLALQQKFADKIASIEKQKAVLSQSIVETQKLLDYTMDKYFG